MSEYINNREFRQKALKNLIMELHDGKPLEEVKSKFEEIFGGVAASEIAEMEQKLISEGLPVEEVQRLCDVHAAVFKGSIENIHSSKDAALNTPGHPLHTFKIENEAVEKYINKTVKPNIEKFKEQKNQQTKNQLIQDFDTLWDLDKHYSRKENILFPFLEKYGITAPPKVMWGVDDEIREGLKEVKNMLVADAEQQLIVQKAEEVINKVLDMIFKEKNILFPMALEHLSEKEWHQVEMDSDEIGYCLVEPQQKWRPRGVTIEEETEEESTGDYVTFETGRLSPKEISLILNNLPVDITFIDKNDVVKYFSQSKDRIFARTRAVIGRNVKNCHPPASVAIVEKLLDDFKSGRKDSEDFWLQLGDAYVYIRYFAIRDKNNEYVGTMEITQNIKPIQQIQGEKRLLDKQPE